MSSQLKDHQKVLYEMLCVVDEICRKHNIKYQLFAGTQLGSIRHHGFIPWDDDLDIIMFRTEYERFLAVAHQELDQNLYFLQCEFSEHWPMTFSKLRKNNTACIERYVPKDPEIHQGIYIDIFPCDSLSNHKFVRYIQFLASKIVIAKSLDKRGYLTDSIIKKVFILLCRLLPLKPFVQLVQYRAETTKMVHSFFGASSRYGRSVYQREWIVETIESPFEGNVFPVSKHYDKLLTCLYGDYMRIPSEEERGCKVHAELIDLNRSFKEYEGIQKTMNFKEYTRSIR